ncbi:MAG: TolC family protein [Gemmatimonadetes bacterium]|nr:TolC family protein [Gemmatimonadota bacterium]
MHSYSCRLSILAVLAFMLALAPDASAQTDPPPQSGATLTLNDAITLARRNNPDFLQQANDVAAADWAVRSAYGQLLPGASASTSYSYQAAGTQRVGSFGDIGVTNSTDYYSSNYNLGVNYRLSGATLLAPGQAKSQRRATAANVEAAIFTLRTNVTRQYLAVKRAQDGVALAEQELQRASDNLRLARARVEVGATIPMEATQAEIERGRAEVALLQAQNLVNTERLRLAQTIGVDLPLDANLTTEFAVTDVPWSETQLQSFAAEAHPSLQAARAAESASQAGVRMARSSYLPSLNFSAGISGFMRQAGNSEYLVDQAWEGVYAQQDQCDLLNRISAGLSDPLPNTPANCSAITLTPDDERRIRENNSLFPFGYERNPFSASLTISLPLFDGLARERQVEQARIARDDAELRRRSEEMRLRTEIAAALGTARTGSRSAELEERNAELAAGQLELARERYRLGAASYIELQEAETLKARADRAYLSALYQFHESLAALEAAVGRPLSGAEFR